MVLGVVGDVLLLGLQAVHLQLNSEVLVQVPEVDQVGEVELEAVKALRGRDHLCGNALASALHKAEEVMDELSGLSTPDEVNKLLLEAKVDAA